MAAGFDPSGRLPDVFTSAGTSSFTEFLSAGRARAAARAAGRCRPGSSADLAPHATTIVAIAYADGVVMAGDRRATMGNLIASRDIEKVHPADAVLAGRHRRHGRHRHRADPAVPGGAGALREDRGRDALPRRQGQPARHDDPRQPRRRHAGPGRGAAVRRLRPRRRPTRPRPAASSASTSPAASTRRPATTRIGSGSLFAKSALKKRYRPGLSRRRGGPARRRGALRRRRRRHRHRRARPDPQDLPGGDDRDRRGHPPAHRRARSARSPRPSSPAAWRTRAAEPPPVPTDPSQTEGEAAAVAMQFYASPEQIMRDRSEYARKGIARGRSAVVLTLRGRRAVRRREPVHRAAQGQRDLRPDRVRRGRPLQRVREPAPGRRADGRPATATRYDRRDVTGRALANAYAQTLGAIFTEQQKPFEVEICVAEVGATPDDDELYRLTYDGSVQDEPASWRWAARPRRSPTCSRTGHRRRHVARRGAEAGGRGAGQRRRRGRRSRAARAPTSSRWRCSTGAAAGRTFRRITGRGADRAARGRQGRPEKEVGEAGDAAPPAPAEDKPTVSAASADLEGEPTRTPRPAAPDRRQRRRDVPAVGTAAADLDHGRRDRVRELRVGAGGGPVVSRCQRAPTSPRLSRYQAHRRGQPGVEVDPRPVAEFARGSCRRPGRTAGRGPCGPRPCRPGPSRRRTPPAAARSGPGWSARRRRRCGRPRRPGRGQRQRDAAAVVVDVHPVADVAGRRRTAAPCGRTAGWSRTAG